MGKALKGLVYRPGSLGDTLVSLPAIAEIRRRYPRHRLTLDPKAKYLINCGAVGQPRDGDPRAACGLFDTESRTLTVLRVPYDVTTAQAKIIAAGLPEVLAQRLAIGR